MRRRRRGKGEWREVCRGRGLAVFAHTGRGRLQVWGQMEGEHASENHGACGAPSQCVVSCNIPPTREGAWRCSPGPVPSKVAVLLGRVGRNHPAGTIEFHFSKQQSASQRGDNERKEMSAPTKEEDYSK